MGYNTGDSIIRRDAINECINTAIELSDKYKHEENLDGQIALLVLANKLMEKLVEELNNG
tara:strand:- start:897 stop:1076 length:180 start_codon:yes stop_codon:yes gene_type:complete